MTRRQTFGDTVVAYRRRHGLTQLALSEMLGISSNMVRRWEHGGVDPRAPQFRTAMDVMEIPESKVASLIEPVGVSRRGSFGHQLRVRRFALGMTGRHLADLLDVYPLTVTRWEHDAFVPSTELLPRLAEAVRWDLDELIAVCPATFRGKRALHTHRDRLEWAAAVREEAGRGAGVYRRLMERWGVTRGVVNARLRVLRSAGYVASDLASMRAT